MCYGKKGLFFVTNGNMTDFHKMKHKISYMRLTSQSLTTTFSADPV